MSEEKQIIEEMAKIAFPFLDVVKPEYYNTAIFGNTHVINPIENLYKANYRKQEWISVEERLPKNYRPVLVACAGLTIGGYAPIAIGSYGGGLWSLADADGTAYLTKYMRCTVTHWMPLPEPPKGV